jgi:hypothetical protein
VWISDNFSTSTSWNESNTTMRVARPTSNIPVCYDPQNLIFLSLQNFNLKRKCYVYCHPTSFYFLDQRVNAIYIGNVYLTPSVLNNI